MTEKRDNKTVAEGLRKIAALYQESELTALHGIVIDAAERLEKEKPSLKDRLKKRLEKIDSTLPGDHQVMLGRNESFLKSLLLGWVIAPFCWPTSLWRVIKEPMIGFFGCGFGIIAGIAAWLFAQLLILVSAPFGFVRIGRRPVESDDEMSAA